MSSLCSIIDSILSLILSTINTVDILDHITTLTLSHILRRAESDTWLTAVPFQIFLYRHISFLHTLVLTSLHFITLRCSMAYNSSGFTPDVSLSAAVIVEWLCYSGKRGMSEICIFWCVGCQAWGMTMYSLGEQGQSTPSSNIQMSCSDAHRRRHARACRRIHSVRRFEKLCFCVSDLFAWISIQCKNPSCSKVKRAQQSMAL